MNGSDSKSIFGVLVGLGALFLLWLWASGNAAQLWAAATGTTVATPPTPAAAATSPSAYMQGSNTTGPVVAAATPAATIGSVAVPQFVNTSPAITTPPASAIAGLTLAGAQSGGVQVTPTVLYNTSSVPATTGYGPGALQNSGVTNWLLNVLDPLGIGGGSVGGTASFGSWDDPSGSATSDASSPWGSSNDSAAAAAAVPVAGVA